MSRLPRMKRVNVVQPEEDQVPTEVLATSIVAISQGVKRLTSGPLNERALILLITNATPKIGKGYRAKTVTPKMVKAVLEGIASLEAEYLK